MCIKATHPVHSAHTVKSFTHSSCVLKTKCYPIGLFMKRMHCPFSSCLAGSTSHACFKALVRQHSYLWNSLLKADGMRTRHMRVNRKQFLSLSTLSFQVWSSHANRASAGLQSQNCCPSGCSCANRGGSRLCRICTWKRVKCFINEIWDLSINTLIYWMLYTPVEHNICQHNTRYTKNQSHGQ